MKNTIEIINRLDEINREMKSNNEKLENLLSELRGESDNGYPEIGGHVEEIGETPATIDEVVGVGDEKNPF